MKIIVAVSISLHIVSLHTHACQRQRLFPPIKNTSPQQSARSYPSAKASYSEPTPLAPSLHSPNSVVGRPPHHLPPLQLIPHAHTSRSIAEQVAVLSHREPPSRSLSQEEWRQQLQECIVRMEHHTGLLVIQSQKFQQLCAEYNGTHMPVVLLGMHQNTEEDKDEA